MAYEKCQTPSGKLARSHYCELLTISDEGKRSFYEKEAVNSGWSGPKRELKLHSQPILSAILMYLSFWGFQASNPVERRSKFTAFVSVTFIF